MNALLSNHALNLHIVQHRLRHLHHLTRHRVNHWLHLHCVLVRVGHDNLCLCLWLLHQNLQGLVVQPRIFLNADRLGFLNPRLHNPALTHQRVLEGRVRNHEAVVVVLEHIVTVVGGLLRVLHILWTARRELDNILGTEEHTHQAWQHS